MATSGSGVQQQQQQQQLSNNGYGPIMRPNTNIGQSTLFPDCWPGSGNNNNNSNTINSSNYWQAMPYGQFNGMAPAGTRMSPGLLSTGNTMQHPAHPALMSYGPPMGYYANANTGNFNISAGSTVSTVSQPSGGGGGQACFDENSIRYPNMMATVPRVHSGCNDPTGHRSVSDGQPGATSSSNENTTVQIKIQCINHSNPININSPSGLNNVANMSCHNHNTNNVCPNQTNISNNNTQKSPVVADTNLIEFPPLQVNNKYKLFDEKPTPTWPNSKGRNDSGDSLSYDIDSDYEMVDVPMVSMAAANQTLHSEITQMSLRGCELAERLAHTHRNRPCFKKIDSLCARTKQDLVRQDSVLANINSQGTAWAVKDFIFVFTRIINAWIIIKGYANNAPEGLSKLKTALSPDFDESFLKWQESTRDFVDNLIKSFFSLDQMVQTQRASFQKFDMSSSSASATAANKPNGHPITHQQTSSRKTDSTGKMESELPIDESLSYVMKLFSLDAESKTGDTSMSPLMADLSSNLVGGLSDQSSAAYLSNVIEDSEETQRQAMEKGTYFKTGLYNPLKKELFPTNSLPTTNEPKSIFTQSAMTSASATFMNRFVAPANTVAADFGIIQSMEPKWNGVPIMTQHHGNDLHVKQTLSNDEYLYQKLIAYNEAHATSNNSAHLQFQHQQMQYKPQPQHLQYMMPQPTTQSGPPPHQQAFKATIEPPAPITAEHQAKTFKNNGADPSFTMANMEYLLSKICSINECKYFFTSKFTQNYFPDFGTVVPHFMDVRTIVCRSYIGAYSSLDEVVHDLRQIVYSGRKYLKTRTSNISMANAVKAFDTELESILRETLFSQYDFSEITGIPDEEAKMQEQDSLFCKTI